MIFGYGFELDFKVAKDFSFGDQFFNDKPPEANNEKTTADTEAESMVSVTIHQDTSAIPPMTSPVIDLVSVPDSPTVHRPLPTTTTATATTTTTTTIMTTIPLPPQPQQVSSDSILINRLGELEQHIADLVDVKQALEERLDKHGSRLYRLENQDIPNQVSKAVDEIVMDAVDWAMHAPLRERFRDLPEADMKEILHNRMWESKSYQTHKDHMTLYEALKKSMARDNRDQLLFDLAEARKKKKKRQGSPKTPPGSPPHPPPPPPPPAGPSETSGASGASGSSQSQPPPPPPSNNQGELHMDDDTTADEQAYSSSGEDVRRDHIPTASALKSTYTPPPENSLLAQIGDMTTFMDWPALSISKMKAAYYPDVGLEQMIPDQMWIEEECKYDVGAMAVRTHMCILSVVRIEVFPMCGYNYMKKIVLRRADLKEYVITERDFKYLYPSDFEDLYLLNLQGYLNHLSPEDKKILTTAVNLWTRNLVIRQRVEDFQLGIESYQTQDKYGVQMIMRFNEIHKFSDGTLHQIDEALDYKSTEKSGQHDENPGFGYTFWTKKDVDRSKEFMFAIQKRLKTRTYLSEILKAIVGEG
ncbi:hypothetical protein Tco_0129274 [Tanacetum coccineum]